MMWTLLPSLQIQNRFTPFIQTENEKKKNKHTKLLEPQNNPTLVAPVCLAMFFPQNVFHQQHLLMMVSYATEYQKNDILYYKNNNKT